MKYWNRLAMAMVFAAVLPAAGAARAGIINGGFEAGDLSGWTASPTTLAQVETTALLLGQGDFGSINPVEGSYFGMISAGDGEGVYTFLSQAFSAGAGDTLSFSVFFDAADELPYNDNAYARLINLDTSSSTQLFYRDVQAVGNNRNSGWVPISTVFAGAGSYKLEFGVENIGDNSASFSSVLAIDAVKVTSPPAVPEPGSVALLGVAALCGLGLKAPRRLKF